jgi:hypothetical protein
MLCCCYGQYARERPIPWRNDYQYEIIRMSVFFRLNHMFKLNLSLKLRLDHIFQNISSSILVVLSYFRAKFLFMLNYV